MIDMSQPLISIITINFNNKKGLARTIESVVKQTVPDYEYILIDGGSTDGSIDIIKQHQNKLAYWISEKDKGIYDAMNKGIQKASGKYLLFLNSGDCFINSVVLEKVNEAMRTNQYDIIYGNSIFNNGESVRYNPTPLSLLNVLRLGISHQAFFLKKELFDKAGLYNIMYKVVADSCHLITCLVKYNASSLYINAIIAEIEPDGISMASTGQNRKEQQLFMRTEFIALQNDYELLLTYYKRDYLTRIRKFMVRKFKLRNR
jgi:glycosyltransferase involved in cell wall biosynthesis